MDRPASSTLEKSGEEKILFNSEIIRGGLERSSVRLSQDSPICMFVALLIIKYSRVTSTSLFLA